MRFRTLLLFVFVCCAAFDGRAESVVVFANGDNGYACFRIPALVRAADGTLLAFAEARRLSSADKGDIDLVMRRSNDNGRTWGAMSVVWDDGENTCGNPTPVVSRGSGRIVMLACWNNGGDHERDIEAGRATDTRRVYALHSDDHGLTWSAPAEITSSVKRPEWTWYATGPCHAVEKSKGPHKGRIVVPANHKWVGEDGVAASASHLLFSDDRGATWQIGAVSQRGGNESSVAELSDGQLMLNMRHYEKRDSLRLCAQSRDGGATFIRMWEEPQLLEPRCQGSLLNYALPGAQPSRTLLFSNPRSLRRENLTIGVSRDNGRTWSRFVPVFKGRAAYSDMVCLPDGSVGVLFENGDSDELYKRISFEVVSPVRLFDRPEIKP